MNFLSVCIASRGKSELFEECLKSLSAQVDPPSYEVLVCTTRDAQVQQQVHRYFPNATITKVPPSLPGGARNALIKQASGELLLFIDDDVVLDQHLLRRLRDSALNHRQIGVFGGPNLTPTSSSRFQAIQGAVLASIIASGPVRRRYGQHPSRPAGEQSLILCNLAIRKEAMIDFATDLACAEENQLLIELERRGVKMHYDPELIVYHERRDTAQAFARQIFKYGYGRGQVLKQDPSGVRLAYIVPSMWLGYVLISPLLAMRSLWALAPLGLYALVVAASGVKISFSLKRRSALTAAAMIVMVHACYGAGVVVGFLPSGSARAGDINQAVLESDAAALSEPDGAMP